ncbi:MAG TPA: NBR1-Ig-like domain-containing protein, partial [Planctomycetota bacterium]|nr:NBR1-Ig-like domain-containing protein [Planctomycetota bacterium]
PTYDALRRFHGDFAGFIAPEIAPYGKTSEFFSAVYPGYPASVRAQIVADYKQRGYTHFPISIRLGDYHGLYPQYDFINDVAGFRVILTELWTSGLIPVVFVIDDQSPAQTPADMAAIQAKYTPFLQAVKDLVFVVVPGWEIDGWMAPANIGAACQWLKQTLPDALVYVHFTSGHQSGAAPGGSDRDWWASMQGVLMGILYQGDGPSGGAAIASELSAFTVRFQTGLNGWPTGFDAVAFEYSAYWQVNQGQSQQWGDAIGDVIWTTTSPPIQGYCDGGTHSVNTGTLPPCPWLPANPAPPPTSGAPIPPPPPPATGDGATLLSASIPARMDPGATVACTVVVQNSGGTTWDPSSYKLGAVGGSDASTFLQGAGGDPNRVWMAAGTTVAPGQSYTFSFNVVAPATPGQGYSLQFQMVHEGVQWFGPVATQAVTINTVASGPSIPPDAVDLSQCTIENSPQDIASWPVTAKVTSLDINANGFDLEFTKKDGPGSWPDYTPPGWSGPIEYTLWSVEKINGKWYASGCIQIWRGENRSGGPPSGFAADWYYDASRWGPLAGYQPAVGEQVGFFVSAGNARNNGDTLVKERSNVVLIPFPSDAGATFTYP